MLHPADYRLQALGIVAYVNLLDTGGKDSIEPFHHLSNCIGCLVQIVYSAMTDT